MTHNSTFKLFIRTVTAEGGVHSFCETFKYRNDADCAYDKLIEASHQTLGGMVHMSVHKLYHVEGAE